MDNDKLIAKNLVPWLARASAVLKLPKPKNKGNLLNYLKYRKSNKLNDELLIKKMVLSLEIC